MTAIRVLAVPYDSGHRGVRMGAGPERILESGLVSRLEDRGHETDVRLVEPRSGQFPTEVGTTFELARALAGEVREAGTLGRLPLVLAGGCMTAVGTVAGLGSVDQVLWFDAHGDLNTPETSSSGFLDGMALAVLLGLCWRPLASAIPGFAPLTSDALTLIGGRDLDPPEAAAIERHGIRHVLRATDALATDWRPGSAYVHLDLDVLDPDEGRANRFAAPAGFTRDALASALEDICGRCDVRALALSAYEPEADSDGRALEAAVQVLLGAVDALAGRGDRTGDGGRG